MTSHQDRAANTGEPDQACDALPPDHGQRGPALDASAAYTSRSPATNGTDDGSASLPPGDSARGEDDHATGLSGEDKALLDFAGLQWRRAGHQAAAIEEQFGITVTRYWQRVNMLLDDPEALAYAPATVNRLRRLRLGRRDAAGRPSSPKPPW